MKPRIMIVNPDVYVYGGAERQIVELCNYLTFHDFSVTVVTGRAVPEFKRGFTDARVVEVGDLSNCKQLFHKFDVINPHNHPAELYVYPAKYPVVWQLNEPPNYVIEGAPLKHEERDIVNKSVDEIVVISQPEKVRVKNLYGRDATVNYPGVRHGFFSEPSSEVFKRMVDRWRLKEKFVMLQCGFLTRTKNQVLAVEILADVKKEVPEAVLVLAGYDGLAAYRAEVVAKAKELGVMDSVVLTGYIQKDEVLRELHHASSVLIAPVLDQGAWLAIFEAVCCGLPIVVSDWFVGANLVRENELGSIVPLERDVFVKEILKIRGDGSIADKTRRGAEWIRDNLTWEKFGEKYAEIFEEVRK